MDILARQEPKLRLPGLRRALLRIHSDLFIIDGQIKRYAAYWPTSLSALEKLTIVLEDRRFFNHQGIDLRSCIREVVRAMTFRRHGGASTIDMQFVRTATGYRQRTLRRKLYEIFLATIIQFRYSKIVILRSYLACAFFGSHLIGANVASKKLYGCNADDLQIDQAAELAAMLVYPRPRLPTANWRIKVERRAEYGKRIYVAHKERFDKLPR
jgi:membrane peptidoglycan carboxypeptidase